MNKPPSPWLMALVGILLACCVFASCGAIVLFVALNDSTPSPSLAIGPSVTPVPSPTVRNTATAKRDSGGSTSVRATPTVLPIKSTTYGISVPTPAAPTIAYDIGFDSDVVVDTYAVYGTTFNALGASLDARALEDPHEQRSRYYARTDWHLGGNWYWKPALRGCSVDHGQVTMQITVTLPLMAEQKAAPANVQNRWARFIENTILHETGHVKIALQGARDYQRDLGNFPVAADCTRLKSQLQDLFDNAFGSIDKANVRYDADTRHGATQGAVFP